MGAMRVGSRSPASTSPDEYLVDVQGVPEARLRIHVGERL